MKQIDRRSNSLLNSPFSNSTAPNTDASTSGIQVLLFKQAMSPEDPNFSGDSNQMHSKKLTLPMDGKTSVKIGRQVSPQNPPAETNGLFDSKVLSRQHAEVMYDPRSQKVYIKDVGSSNGTFVNGERLSEEGQPSPFVALRNGDSLVFGVDIVDEDGATILYKKVSGTVSILSASSSNLDSRVSGKSLDDSILFQQKDLGSFDGSAGLMSPASTGASYDVVFSILEREYQAAKQNDMDLARLKENLLTIQEVIDDKSSLLSKKDLEDNSKVDFELAEMQKELEEWQSKHDRLAELLIKERKKNDLANEEGPQTVSNDVFVQNQEKLSELQNTELELKNKIGEMQAKLQEAEQLSNSYREQVEHLETKLEASNDELQNISANLLNSETLNDQIQELNTQLETARKQLVEEQQNRDELQKELDNARGDLDRANIEKSRIDEDSINQLKAENDEFRRTHSALQEEIKLKEQKLEEQNNRCETLSQSMRSLEQEKAVLEKNCEEISAKAATEVEVLNQEKEKLDSEKAEIQELYTQATQELETIRTQLENEKQKSAQIAQEFDSFKRESSNEREDLLQKMQNAEQSVSQASLEKTQVEEKCKKFEESIVNIEGEKSNLQVKVQSLDQQSLELKSALEQKDELLKNALDSKKTALQDLEQKIENFKSELETARRDYTSLKKEADEQRESSAKSKQDNQAEISKLSEKMKNLQSENKQLKSEVEKLNEEITALQHKPKSYKVGFATPIYLSIIFGLVAYVIVLKDDQIWKRIINLMEQ